MAATAEGEPHSSPSALLSGPTATPLGWRVAALGILAGGTAAGVIAGTRRPPAWLPFLAAAATGACAIPLAAAARRPPISARQAAAALRTSERPPTFSVVVAARDEAAVLARLVRDVACQDYRDAAGRPRFELVVVDDRSTDGTGPTVRAKADELGIGEVTRVFRREGERLADGKGAALVAAPAEACSGDVVLVLDADARLGPDFLRRAAGYFSAGARAVTARRRILDAGTGQLAAAQADEQTLDGEINAARWSLGGCSEFRGNGIMISRELLIEAGGWRASALTEDIDLSSRVAAVAGVGVAWAIDAEVWEEPVRELRGLWRQRLRWAEGAFRRAFEHGPAVLASPRLSVRGRLDFATYVGQLVAPTLVIGSAGAAVVSGRRRGFLSILAAYVGLTAVLGWDALRLERGSDGRPLPGRERLVRATRLSVFNGFWIPVVPRALLDLAFRRGPVRYVKMEHRGTAGGGELPAAAPDDGRIGE